MNIIIFSGAGLSAESGLSTFRDEDGLWSGHSVDEVATPEGFRTDPAKVHAFYNDRRRELKKAKPNRAHEAVARLQREHNKVVIITQNVDNLLEVAGCEDVLHVHGELSKCRCLLCKQEQEWWEDTNVDLACPKCGKNSNWGSLRPAIVWFNEMPLELPRVERELQDTDLFISIGTSGQVYPAAGFSATAKLNGAKTMVFNLEPPSNLSSNDEFVQGQAGDTFPAWVEQFLKAG